MRALTESFASSILVAASLLVPAPPLAQGASESSTPAPSTTQGTRRANILVVGPFDSVGTLVAGAVRNRLAADTAGRPIWIIPHRDIAANLRLAGFDMKAPISQADLRQLASFMRADMWVSLSVEQTAGDLRVSASAAGVRDAAGRSLAQNIVGSVGVVSDQLVQAIRLDTTYRRLRRR